MFSFVRNLPLTRIKIALAGVLYQIVRFFLRSDHRRMTRAGITYDVDLAEGIDLSLYLFGTYQPHLFKLPHLDGSSDIGIIDVGANIGATALKYAQVFPNSRVLAFEPSRQTYAKLQQNLSLNPRLSERISAFNLFVSDNEANNGLTAYSSWRLDRSVDGDRHPIHGGSTTDTSGIPSVVLDRFLDDETVGSIGLIKIDTDGHELQVIKGARETLKCHQPLVVFECGQYILREHKQSIDDFLDVFHGLGYQLFESRSGALVNAESYDDLVPRMSTADIFAVPVRAKATAVNGLGIARWLLARNVVSSQARAA